MPALHYRHSAVKGTWLVECADMPITKSDNLSGVFVKELLNYVIPGINAMEYLLSNFFIRINFIIYWRTY